MFGSDTLRIRSRAAIVTNIDSEEAVPIVDAVVVVGVVVVFVTADGLDFVVDISVEKLFAFGIVVIVDVQFGFVELLLLLLVLLFDVLDRVPSAAVHSPLGECKYLPPLPDDVPLAVGEP